MVFVLFNVLVFLLSNFLCLFNLSHCKHSFIYKDLPFNSILRPCLISGMSMRVAKNIIAQERIPIFWAPILLTV